MRRNIFLIYLALLSLTLFASPLERYESKILFYAKEYNLTPAFIKNFILAESSGNPYALNFNKDGTVDIGLLQQNSRSIPDFYRWYNKGKPYDPLDWEENLRISLAHFARMRKKTGSLKGALCAYNMGLTGYYEYQAGKRPLPEETKILIKRVLKEF